MSRNRYSDAIHIQEGACNPMGITNSLLNAMKQCRDENTDIRTDPACRLICHQLAFIMRTGEFDNSPESYDKALDECEAKI